MKRLSKQQKLEREWKDYNKRMKSLGLKTRTLESYIRYRKGKSLYKPKVVKSKLEAKTQVRQAPKYPSGDGIGVSSPKKVENKYTGDKLLGIGTMHKSNMVPIFKGEDAEDIAKMRRN